MIDLASDTVAGAAPEILAALAAANIGTEPGYGADEWTLRAAAKLELVFETPLNAFLLGNGTAANALPLAHLTPPWGAILAHEGAHVAVAECNAPEHFSGGAKVVGLPGRDGKVAPEALAAWIDSSRTGAPGRPRANVLSLTQCTDVGAVYSVAEIALLSSIAHDAGLAVHMDGARLATALAATGVLPADMTWRAGIDVLSLGSSKGGTMNAEAVIFFARERAEGFAFRLRQGGHAVAKGRYLGAQMLAWLEDDRWLIKAAHANRMAQKIAAALVRHGNRLQHPVEANLIFAELRREYATYLATKNVHFAGSEKRARFVTNWATTDADAAIFLMDG